MPSVDLIFTRWGVGCGWREKVQNMASHNNSGHTTRPKIYLS